ncbi:MAG: HPr family phosphocarrier protein [Desulfovibrio sp.]|nr:HPr family phosphocarrier protein [Desulfovibrio sp.]
MTSPLTVSRPVRVMDNLGLHARPAAKVARTARQFQSDIFLSWRGVSADAKNILDILFLSAPHNACLTLLCSGNDASEAAESLARLFQHPLLTESS